MQVADAFACGRQIHSKLLRYSYKNINMGYTQKNFACQVEDMSGSFWLSVLLWVSCHGTRGTLEPYIQAITVGKP